jgi:hypothetical protein
MKKLMLLVLLGVIVAFGGTVNAGLGDGLVGYWPFDDNADDMIGDNNGTLMGSASYVDGKLGKAVSTSNENTVDYVAFDTTSDGLTGAWTVAAWMYVHRQDVGGFIDGYFGDPADDDCYGLRLPGAFGAVSHPGMVDYVNNINASWDGEDSQTQAYDTLFNTWTLMVFVGSDTQCELFADGVSQGTIVFAETMGTHGSDPTGDPMQFKLTWDRLGNMVKYPSYGNAVADYDELAIWDRNLTYEEIQDLWNNGQGTQLLLPSNPSPADGATVPVGNVDLSWTNLDPNVGDITYVDVWFGTEPNETHPGYDMTKVVTAGENTTTVQVSAPTAGTYYWQVVNYIYGPDNINEPNAIIGSVWSFIAVEDFAPTVAIDTIDMMTWSGEPVPLDATVTDDGVSALTYLWTADPPDGVVFAPSAAVEDPTVTITKATTNPSTVTLTVAVHDEGNPTPDTDTMEIDVYDDACQLARIGLGLTKITDLDNNCITDLRDYAILAAKWLDSYVATGPLDRQ